MTDDGSETLLRDLKRLDKKKHLKQALEDVQRYRYESAVQFGKNIPLSASEWYNVNKNDKKQDSKQVKVMWKTLYNELLSAISSNPFFSRILLAYFQEDTSDSDDESRYTKSDEERAAKVVLASQRSTVNVLKKSKDSKDDITPTPDS